MFNFFIPKKGLTLIISILIVKDHDNLFDQLQFYFKYLEFNSWTRIRTWFLLIIYIYITIIHNAVLLLLFCRYEIKKFIIYSLIWPGCESIYYASFDVLPKMMIIPLYIQRNYHVNYIIFILLGGFLFFKIVLLRVYNGISLLLLFMMNIITSSLLLTFNTLKNYKNCSNNHIEDVLVYCFILVVIVSLFTYLIIITVLTFGEFLRYFRFIFKVMLFVH